MIKVAHIGKRYGKKTVLKDISFEQSQGSKLRSLEETAVEKRR